MRIRVVLTWISLFPIVSLIIFLLVQNYLDLVIRKIIFFVILALLVFWPYYIILIVLFIATPSSPLPSKVSMLSYISDIKCYQISKSTFDVSLYNKLLKIDMSGWLFKKTYIRDIVLLYYHLDFYNRKIDSSWKCNSKKYFLNQNLNLIFKMKNGIVKKIPLIKNGKEKRSIILDVKILIYTQKWFFFKKPNYKYPKHKKFDIGNFYV